MSRSILRNAAVPQAFKHKPSDRIFERSAYVKVRPTPSSLSERRALLVALQQSGTVEIFKRLPDISTFICVFEKTYDLVKLLSQQQPMIVKYIAEQLQAIKPDASPSFKPVHVAAPIEVHFPEGGQHDPSEENDSDPVKTFNVTVTFAGRNYNHKTIIRKNLIHSRWPRPKPQDRDFVYHALSEVVPNTITKEGLCDWVTGGQQSEDARLAWTDDELAAKWSISQRFERRQNAERAPMSTDHDLVFFESLRDFATEPEHASAQGSATSIADDGSDRKPKKSIGAAKSDGESLEKTASEAARIQGPSLKAHQENAEDASDKEKGLLMYPRNRPLTQLLDMLRSKPEFKSQTLTIKRKGTL